ncbi:MAG: winged helix-turn-helix domain-containing protein, partial [Cytophagaceae bacterium]
IKYIREDGKIDLALYGDKKSQIGDSKEVVWKKLEEQGAIELSDKSSPEEISKVLGISKRNFKMAIGGLYKEGKIKIETNRIVKI